MGQARLAVVVVVMSYSAACAAPLIEKRSGSGKRRSGCRGDVASAARAALLIEERSEGGMCRGNTKRRSGCRSDESGGRKAATNPTTAAAAASKAYRPR